MGAAHGAEETVTRETPGLGLVGLHFAKAARCAGWA